MVLRERTLEEIKIKRGTFIEFKIKNEGYFINSNKEGLQTFIKILNKLKFFGYNFVHLSDINIDEFYIHWTDYFFDSSSNVLNIEKLESFYTEDKIYEYEGINNKQCLTISLTKKTLNHLIKNIKNLIKMRKGTIIITLNDKMKNKIYFNLDDFATKRK